MLIANVALTDTFKVWLDRTNETTVRLNTIAPSGNTISANSVTANTLSVNTILTFNNFQANNLSSNGQLLFDFSSGLHNQRNGVVYKIWDEGNDGSGSGLDADTVDGNHANIFAFRSNNLSDLASASTARVNLNLGNVPNEDATDPFNMDQRGAVDGDALVWSGANLRWEPTSIKTADPTLSTTSVTVNEGDTTSITITNFEKGLIYSTQDDTFATATQSGNTVIIEGLEVTADEVETVRINAKTPGQTVSDWVDITVTVTNVPVTGDTAIQVTNFSGEDDTNDGWDQV